MKTFEARAFLTVRAETREEAEKMMWNAVPALLRAHADADSGIDLSIDDGPLEDVTDDYEDDDDA